MMVLCCLSGVSASGGGSSTYCDTLSVSQYDSKVRSDFPGLGKMHIYLRILPFRKSLDNLF